MHPTNKGLRHKMDAFIKKHKKNQTQHIKKKKDHIKYNRHIKNNEDPETEE